MSGASLDGVDAVLVEFTSFDPFLVSTAYLPIPGTLNAELHALQAPGTNELNRAACASNALARMYAEAVLTLLSKAGFTPAAIRACGCHGQTVRHRPESGYSLQFGNGTSAAAARTTSQSSLACVKICPNGGSPRPPRWEWTRTGSSRLRLPG